MSVARTVCPSSVDPPVDDAIVRDSRPPVLPRVSDTAAGRRGIRSLPLERTLSCSISAGGGAREAHQPEEGRMASKLRIKVNGLMHSVTASLDTPLLYVLHNELHLHGPR